jgi:hypothetical protein
MMRPLLSSFLAASLLLSSAVTRADDTTPAPEAPKPQTTFYGYQTLATDGVALALMLPAMLSKESPTRQGFGVGALTMYGLGAPIVHFSHGHVGKGFLDLGLRVALPIALLYAGAGLGSLSGPCSSNAGSTTSPGCPSGESFNLDGPVILGAIAGFFIGVIGASSIDAGILARESAPPDAATPPPPRSWTSSLQPAVGVVPEKGGGTRATFGLTGAF